MNINDFFQVPILSFPPQVCLSRLKFVHLLPVEIDYQQSLFLFRFSERSAGTLECWSKKWGRQPETKKEKKCLFGVSDLSHTFCYTGGHLHVLHILLDWPRKKRDCYCRELILYEVESGLHHLQCMQVLLLLFERQLWKHCWHSSNLLIKAPYPSLLRCLCCRLRCRSGLQLFSQDGWSMDSERFVCSWAKVEKFLWKPNCNTVCSQNSCE